MESGEEHARLLLTRNGYYGQPVPLSTQKTRQKTGDWQRSLARALLANRLCLRLSPQWLWCWLWHADCDVVATLEGLLAALTTPERV